MIPTGAGARRILPQGAASMKPFKRRWSSIVLATTTALVSVAPAQAQQPPDRGASSYMPVDIKEPFATIMARMKAAQPAVQKRQTDLLAERCDLTDRPAAGVQMSCG